MKDLFIRFTLRVLRRRLSICKCASFPFGFEGGMCDLIVHAREIKTLHVFNEDFRDNELSCFPETLRNSTKRPL